MFLRTVLVLTLAALLTACASAYKEKLESWMGRDVNELIAAWGPPSSTFTLPNGDTMYTWGRSSQYTQPVYQAPSTSTTRIVGNTAYTTTQPGMVTGGQTYNFACTTTMTVSGSRITAYRFEGNACR
jgi:hypothetical protein